MTSRPSRSPIFRRRAVRPGFRGWRVTGNGTLLQTATDAAGHVWTYNTYNAYGQPLTLTDPNGVLTTLTYLHASG